MNGPAIMESHLAGKAHHKKASAINEQNASALATSFVKSVREETDNNASMMDMDQSTKAENPVAQPQEVGERFNHHFMALSRYLGPVLVDLSFRNLFTKLS